MRKMLGNKCDVGNNQLVSDYVEFVEGAYLVTGSRVSLDSLVAAFQRGASAESIQRSFPTLTLESVYGAIAYYLANQETVDKNLAKGDAEFDDLQKRSRSVHQAWYSRLAAAREEIPVS